MKKNGKNEELQSRREFFKRAAKGALPILAGAALLSSPILSETANAMSCAGCNNRCMNSCFNTLKSWLIGHFGCFLGVFFGIFQIA